MSLPISVRNNLKVPIRFTATISSDGRDDNRILITIGEEGATLREYYRVCIDQDFEPNEKWEDVGTLTVEPHYHLKLQGREEKEEK